MFDIIVAADLNNGIGKNGSIPWHIKEDMAFFKEQTAGNTVIMGRKTWESLPTKPLSNRVNIVLSRDSSLILPKGVLLANSLNEALALSLDNAFVIGGSLVYNEAIIHPNCEYIKLTRIFADYDCDTFFPNMPNNFKLVEAELHEDNSGIKYTFYKYFNPIPGNLFKEGI